jgi:signal transduction histidine kinase
VSTRLDEVARAPTLAAGRGAAPRPAAPPSVPPPSRGRGRLFDRLAARWGTELFLDRALLGGTAAAMALATLLLALRAVARGESALPTLVAGALLLGALGRAGAQCPPQRALALALLAGAALAALTVANPAYDPMVLVEYCLSLVLVALVLGAAHTAAITLHYFLYYALFNVLVAPPSQAGLHWEALAGTVLVFEGIALAVWSLAAGQRWLRASRLATEQANAQLAATLAREQRFVADVAHQLRTPLAILRASIELLSADSTPNPVAVRQTLTDVEREAERLSRTVDDLLALSRADASQPIATEPVDVLELAEVVYVQGRRLPGGERLQLDLGDEPERWDWLVRGDERLLQQVLLNLVDNALKYSPDDQPVRLALAAAGDRVVVAVADHGPGIPPEEQERIFERYYRGAHTGRAAGSGLGLCIGRWIAQAHGGSLTVESAPGQGSTFRLALPCWHSPRDI